MEHAESNPCNRMYVSISKRLNLQSIGYYIREGSNLLHPDETSFKERIKRASDKLEKELNERFDEKTVESLLPVIWEYTEKKEEVQFSLGMKAGAKLTTLLLGDSEYDF